MMTMMMMMRETLSTILILFRANEIVKNGNMCGERKKNQYVTPNDAG